MWRRWQDSRAGVVVRLVAAVALAAAPIIAWAATEPAAKERSASRSPTLHAGDEAIVDQFLMLAFDADPASGTPARTALARWLEGVRIVVAGDPADQAVVARAAAALAPLTGLPMEIVAGGQPNMLVAVVADPGAAFAGPLRRFLELAFAGDEAGLAGFLRSIVAVEPCWVLPVWADPEQTVIKAAVIGVDARIGHPDVDRCVVREMAASMGLLGAGGYLPRSIFNPHAVATLPSFEDRVMLRLLYAPALSAGMTRERAAAAAHAAVPQLRGR
jgi:hypothetical protein